LFSLYFRYYTQPFLVTRLIKNKVNKVQWVDFKLENVLVSLHSFKTMGLDAIIFKEWRVTRTFPYSQMTPSLLIMAYNLQRYIRPRHSRSDRVQRYIFTPKFYLKNMQQYLMYTSYFPYDEQTRIRSRKSYGNDNGLKYITF
jgi:hypothetical protein